MRTKKVLALMMVLGLLVMGTVFAKGSSETSKSTTTVTWLASRPVGGAIDLTIREIAPRV